MHHWLRGDGLHCTDEFKNSSLRKEDDVAGGIPGGCIRRLRMDR